MTTIAFVTKMQEGNCQWVAGKKGFRWSTDEFDPEVEAPETPCALNSAVVGCFGIF